MPSSTATGTIEVAAEPLTAGRFAPFGDVVSAGLKAGVAANQGTAVRFDWSAQLESTRAQAKPNLAVFRAVPQALPLPVKLLERHPHSTQTFLPLLVARYLVCVAPDGPDGGPDLGGLRAFVCGPGQGVSYRRACWHHPIVALDTVAEFAVLVWEDGSPGDCEIWPLPEPLLLRG